MSRPYHYEPLTPETGAVRLLRLLKGPSTHEVRCELFSAALFGPRKRRFEALSYHWGAASDLDEVLIEDQDGTSTLHVTPNLHTALRYLRSENQDRVIWVDAICINQSDKKEKGHQIEQMRHVYTEATQVLIWLGQANERTERIMESMAWLHRQVSADPLAWRDSTRRRAIAGPLFRQRLEDERATEHTRQVEALQELLTHPWFQRVWVLQEAACARAGTVICGSESVPTEILAIMPSLFGLEIDDNVQAVLEILPGQSRDGSWWARRRDLHFLMRKFHSCKATDPKDNIFALLGMSSDASQPGVFSPNYEQSLEAVRRDTLCFLLFGRVLPGSIIQLPSFTFSELAEYVDNLSLLGSRVIEWTVEHGYDQTTVFLLKEGEYEATGITPLAISKYGGRHMLLQYLLDQDASAINSVNRFGETPLSISAMKGDAGAVRILLGCHNVDVNHKDNNGLTPLAVAVIHGHLDIVQLLLSNAEVNIHEGGFLETTPLILSSLLGHSEIQETLSTHQPSNGDRVPRGKTLVYLNRKLLAIMARDNDVGGLERLIQQGVNYDFTDHAGQSPLMHAAMKGATDTMAVLLVEVSHGIIQVDRLDLTGRTALSHAAEMGELDACGVLMLCGADIDKVDHDNKSARDWAEEKWTLEGLWSKIEELYWSLVGPSEQEVWGLVPTHVALSYMFNSLSLEKKESAQEERVFQMALELRSAVERFVDRRTFDVYALLHIERMRRKLKDAFGSDQSLLVFTCGRTGLSPVPFL